MSDPVVRMMTDEITITTQFSNFTPGSDYRLGVGTTGEQMRMADFELLEGGRSLSRRLMIFRQGFAAPWFRVGQILVQGFVFSSISLSAHGEGLTLKFTISRSEANRLGRLFLVLARRQVRDRWYIVDGMEINRSHW